MNEELITLSIPLFFVSMAIELFANRAWLAAHPLPHRRGFGAYRFADTFTNLACGVGNQLFDPILRVFGLWAYAAVYALAPLRLAPTGAVTWVVALVGVDFMYYWFHRVSHRVNALWAVHAVHHQSEEYNLSVALRQPWLEKLFDVPFYLPLAFLGVPPELFVTSFTLNLIYQFFLHASFVPKLGPLELVLNTPSHHRVHHGIDPQYIDRNYGGVLVIWDRLFGSFIEEGDEVHYGTVKPLASWNPLGANLALWAQLGGMAAETRRFRDKVAVFFAPPEWRPADLGGPVVVPPVAPDRTLYDVPSSPLKRALATVAFIVASAVLLVSLGQHDSLGLGALVMVLVGVVALLALTGTWLDRAAPRREAAILRAAPGAQELEIPSRDA